MAIQKTMLQTVINGVVASVYPKTSSDIVTYSNDDFFSERSLTIDNVKDTLDYVLQEIVDIEAGEVAFDTIETMITNACNDLYETIMGEDYEEIQETYKTLKGIADWIEGHGADATAMMESIEALESAVFVYDDRTQSYDTTKYNFSKVEASETNGNIVVDGEEVVVYTSPVGDEDYARWNQAAEDATQALADAATAQTAADEAQAAADSAQEAAEAAQEAAEEAAEAAKDVIVFVENEEAMPSELTDGVLYLVGIE